MNYAEIKKSIEYFCEIDWPGYALEMSISAEKVKALIDIIEKQREFIMQDEKYNIVWHDPKEKPIVGTALLLEYENGDFETWNHYNSPALWDDFCERHVLVEWAYIPLKE